MKYVYEFQKGLYINLTNRCTNHCIFCDREKLQKSVNADLILKKEPTANVVIKNIKEKLQKNNYNEIVFCGVGEPTLKIDVIIHIIKAIKIFSTVSIRLNTNGQGYIIYNKRNIADELKIAGLNKINISLNATNTLDYERVCRPYTKGAFREIIRFIENCRDNGIDVTISFVKGYVDCINATNLAKKLGVNAKIREKI